MTDERKAFEAWVSAPPRERVVTRFAADAGAPWPGQYHDYKVQIAWDAWQESRRTAIAETREELAKRILAALNDQITREEYGHAKAAITIVQQRIAAILRGEGK